MPDSDTDFVAHTMEGSGPFNPTVLATTPKKRKAKKSKKSRKRRKSFANTGSDTSSNHSESDPPIEEASIQPVLTEEPDNNTNETTEQVVVAVPVVAQTTLQKKRFVWSFSIDPDLPNFLVDDNNYQDELLIRCIIQESPWRAKHGAKKTSWESVMLLLGNQQHELSNVFDGATMITIRRRYEGYLNLAKMWTSESQERQT